MLIVRRFLISILMFCVGLNLHASEGQANVFETMELSLEDLLNLEVITTSKKRESISESPSIISSINMEQMQSIGIHSLRDALSMLPGILINKSHPGQSQVMIRGLSETFNQKVLFLLDGAPYWMSSHADIPILGMPIEMISRIEVIRGPGAIMYGTNASAGVINVILKKDIDETKLAMRMGSFGTSSFDAYHSAKTDAGYWYMGGALQGMHTGYEVEWHDSLTLGKEGSDGYSVGKDRLTGQEIVQAWPEDANQIQKDEYANAVVGFKHNIYSAKLHYFQSTQTGLGGLVTVWENTDYLQTGLLLDLGVTDKNGELEYETYFRHNIMYLDFTTSNFINVKQRTELIDDNNRVSNDGSGAPFVVQDMELGHQTYLDPYENNYRQTVGGNFSYQLLKSLTWLNGLELEIRSTGEYQRTNANGEFDSLQAEASKLKERSFFSQVDWRSEKIRAVFGARYVDNEQAGENVSPRVSGIYHIDQSQSIKLLYSVGFNSPTISQTALNINDFIFGNKALEAETVSTWDFAYTKALSGQIWIANAYYIRADNFIAREFKNPVPGLKDGPGIQLSNSDKFTRSGFELDYQRIWTRFSLTTNMAYNVEGNETNSEDLLANGVPRITFNTGLKYKIDGPQSVGVSLRYWSERGGDDLPGLVADNGVGSTKILL